MTGVRKPYITPYAEESVELPLTFERGRLSYRDAVPGEWMFGALWARCGAVRDGTVLWAMVHTLRQRRCMLKKLCRVCGRSATDPATGRLWWVTPAPVTGMTWPTVGPPICRDHVTEALTSCPRLRRGSPAVYTVGDYTPIGILANLYTHDGQVTETRHQVAIGLDDTHLLPYALATQLIVSLHDLSPKTLRRR
ncbi:hypothetical protein [Streptosporangium saharense]|uniref:hypothetical protein n=1 Tax=Streptosporangium saharense TaxID=1706840 RepID=UPI00342AD219